MNAMRRIGSLISALVFVLSLCLSGLGTISVSAAPGVIYVQAIGNDGWKSDDTRSATGVDLVGVSYTHYGKPGQTPTEADDTAIGQMIQFVHDAPGNTAALKLTKTSVSGGWSKATLSKVNESGFATGDSWVSGFFARYPYYTNTTAETAVIKIGIRSTLWGTGPDQSQNGFTAIRSGESVWDLILVHWLDTPTANSWQTVNLDADTKAWYVYRQAGNTFFSAPNNIKRSLNELKVWTDVAKKIGDTNYTWGDVLFGTGAKVVNIQFGVDSSQQNSTSYIDWVETNLLNGGERVEFGMLQERVWIKHPGNPVLVGDSPAEDPCVIKDGDKYKMWYTRHSDWTIWYADSDDGVTWGNKQQVLAASGDEVRVVGPAVIKDGATYKMWYGGRTSGAVWSIRYATSSDGISWTKLLENGNPKKVLNVGGPGAWDSAIVREPWVIKDGSTYKMWYSGCAVWPVFKIGYATSPDGVAWTKHASNPVFTGTPGGWDGFQVYAPSVVKDGDTYHMYFSGTDNNNSAVWSTGYATSSDGVAWTEGSRNPILVPDRLDSLDFVSTMNDGGTWKLWYSYVHTTGKYVIGLATLGTETELYYAPGVASIRNNNNDTATFTIRLANAVNLYGYQYVVTFDPAKLEATAAVIDESFFDGSPVSGWEATINNAAGTVKFASSRVRPDAAVNGSGPLGTVTLRSKSGAAAGRYRIDFVKEGPEQVMLGDVEGNSLPVSTSHAWLTLYGVGNLQGTVDLQGRTNESGAQVQVVKASGYMTTTTTNTAGAWSFTGIPAGSYAVYVEMERYLDGYKGGVNVPAGGTTTLSQVKLLGGDCFGTVDDDVINISDIVVIGGLFGTTVDPATTRADINYDSAVNILDLVLAAGNYGLASPVAWP